MIILALFSNVLLAFPLRTYPSHRKTTLSGGPLFSISSPKHPNLEQIYENPDVFTIEQFLPEEVCNDLISFAQNNQELTISSEPVAQIDNKRLQLLFVPVTLSGLVPLAFHPPERLDFWHVTEVIAPPVLCAAVVSFLLAKIVPKLLRSPRTSSSVSLSSAATSSSLPEMVTRRVEDLFGDESFDCFEAPVVTRYKEGERFGLHCDASLDPEGDWGEEGGQRRATVIMYLNNVGGNAGGRTFFPRLQLAVTPRRGLALVFFPSDDKGVSDERTEHEAEVVMGMGEEKWVCQVWRRERSVPFPMGMKKALVE